MKFYTNVRHIGVNLLVRGIEDGIPFKEKVKYQPTLFVRAGKETKYKDIYGASCAPIKFETIPEAIQWIDDQKGVSNSSVLGMDNFPLAYISDAYKNTEYDPDQVRVNYIDIEVYHRGGFPEPIKAPGVIDAITIYDNIDDKYHVWGLKSWKRKDSSLNQTVTVDKGKNAFEVDLNKDILDKVNYMQFATEKELLINFLQHWQENTPDLITGWNIDGFDMPYIVKRIEKLFGESAVNKLSPWGRVRQRTKTDFGKEKLLVDVYGVSSIDYMATYQKFGFRPPRAFYTLDYISYAELNQQKLEYDGSHADQSDNDYQGYIDYNIKDVWLVVQLNKKLELLRLVMGLAYDSCMNYGDAFSPVKMWDSIIFNHLKEKDIVIPENKYEDKQPFPGAYVKEVQPGLYKWIMSFDLTSLYPMLINQYNISPETIRDKLPQLDIMDYVNKEAHIPSPDLSTAANGMQYTKEFKGVVPIVAEKVFNDRKKHKGLMLDAKKLAETDKKNAAKHKQKATLENVLQMSKKIAINSLYGALGNRFFRYYDINNASAVTLSGQLSIQWIERKLNEYFDKILGVKKDRCVAIDTDSVYFNLEDFVDRYLSDRSTEEIVDALDKFANEKCEPYILKCYEELADYMNAYEQRMFMDREAIADTGFWTAKKRYALNVWDMEGVRYDEPEQKIMGLETQKSSTPTFVQDALKECIRIILQEDNDSLIKYLDNFEKHFKEHDYRDICMISSVNNIGKYSDKEGMPLKGAQTHVKAALAYNRLCKDTDVSPITDGEKIGILPLKEPNRLKSPAIGFPASGLPNDFDIDYIMEKANYNNIYEKVFLAPMNLIATAIEWKLEDSVDLSDFFA